MPDDPTLTSLFGQLHDNPRVDVDAVLRRARRRRLPKQIAIGAASTLAVAGIVVASVQGLAINQDATTSAGASDEAPSAEMFSDSSAASGLMVDDGTKRAGADKINLCTGPLAEVAPSESGLVATTRFDDASADDESVGGVVTITNSGTESVSGSMSSWVSVTLSQDGVTLWHTNGQHDSDAREISLAPGESVDIDAVLEPLVCSIEDDSAEQFRSDLPHVEPGTYEVTAAVDVFIGDTLELVTGPSSEITLQ